MRAHWRVNRVGSAVCVTSVLGDGLDELFRHPDEATVLLDVCEREQLFDGVSVLADPFCGVGHVVLGAPRRLAVVGSDLSPRAVRYATANARLNLRRRARFRVADVRHPAAWAPLRSAQGRLLVATNPPFGPLPHSGRGPHHSAGGHYGDDLLLSALRMLVRFTPEARSALLGVALVGQGGRNSLLERSGGVTAQRQHWRHLVGERFWRLGDEHELTSPAVLHDVAAVAASHSHWGTPQEWQAWAQAMSDAGYEQLEYGVLIGR